MANTESEDVQEHLRKVRKSIDKGKKAPDQQLVFDPSTGELVLIGPEENITDPDAVVADAIAEDGFFSE